MLQFTMLLSDKSPAGNVLRGKPPLIAKVLVSSAGDNTRVSIILKGVLVGTDCVALQRFLEKITDLPGNEWGLHVGELQALDQQGVHCLVRFAETIRRRGFNLKVHGIHQDVDASLHNVEPGGASDQSNATSSPAWQN